jgi:hypothetical protein
MAGRKRNRVISGKAVEMKPRRFAAGFFIGHEKHEKARKGVRELRSCLPASLK